MGRAWENQHFVKDGLIVIISSNFKQKNSTTHTNFPPNFLQGLQCRDLNHVIRSSPFNGYFVQIIENNEYCMFKMQELFNTFNCIHK